MISGLFELAVILSPVSVAQGYALSILLWLLIAQFLVTRALVKRMQ